jgi:hypothetical protein
MAQPKAGRARRNRIGVLGLAGAALVALSGCAAGQYAQTADETPAIDGVAVDIGTMNVRAVAVVAPSQPSYPQGGSAPLQLVLVNAGQQPDTLRTVTTDVASGVTFYPSVAAMQSALGISTPTSSGATSAASSSGTSAASSSPSSTSGRAGPTLSGITVQPTQRVSIGIVDTDPAIVLTGLTKPLFPAQSFRITFGFANSGSGTFAVAVHLGQAPSNRPTLDISPTDAP